MAFVQPPSGGCVLKQNLRLIRISLLAQPPSGGCVLKPWGDFDGNGTKASRLRAAVC